MWKGEHYVNENERKLLYKKMLWRFCVIKKEERIKKNVKKYWKESVYMVLLKRRKKQSSKR